uniref:Putative Penicillin-binding protein 2 n=1 Tax=Magnetococcus massalia (strain MO-1) TaxID=451514 RepID=A0A1S7LCA8_MAGMO|nr:putative Penicillin-binding protein 2 [Candidatus Magnetococcus massalia]
MLEDEQERFRFDARRRILLLGGIKGGLFLILAGRLFQLQVLKGGTYQDLAEDNRISWHPVPAPRGRIFDRYGRTLVENSPDYRLMATPERAENFQSLLKRLQPHVGLTDEEIELALEQARTQRSFLPVSIKKQLTWEAVSRVEARIHDFPGVMIQAQSQRDYPHSDLAAHLLGYLGEVGEPDRTHFRAIDFRSGDLVGKSGMERQFEERLRGQEGIAEIEVNAVGRKVRQLNETPPIPGRDLVLTLDMDLQRDAQEALGDRAGAVVVMDPRNGEILAMVSSPAYDPNHFIQGFSSEEWKNLINDSDRPLSNKVLRGQYPPGSTFKMVVLLAGLQMGAIKPSDRLFCGGHLDLKGHRFHCWHRGGHGRVNLNQAISQSCDVYFYRLAEKVGIDAIHDMSSRLGFGHPTQLGLDGEKPGLNPSRQWKRLVHNKIWFPGETLLTAIGQGYLLATPLQMANMVSTIANGGTLYQPALVRPRGGYDPQVLRHTRIDSEHLGIIRYAMEMVYYGKAGTARNSIPETVRAAGKTGTSQVVGHRGERKKDKDRKKQHRDHALFVSYAPSDDPQLAIATVVEHGGSGGVAAAPVAKQIIDAHFKRRKEHWERRAV